MWCGWPFIPVGRKSSWLGGWWWWGGRTSGGLWDSSSWSVASWRLIPCDSCCVARCGSARPGCHFTHRRPLSCAQARAHADLKLCVQLYALEVMTVQERQHTHKHFACWKSNSEGEEERRWSAQSDQTNLEMMPSRRVKQVSASFSALTLLPPSAPTCEWQRSVSAATRSLSAQMWHFAMSVCATPPAVGATKCTIPTAEWLMLSFAWT